LTGDAKHCNEQAGKRGRFEMEPSKADSGIFPSERLVVFSDGVMAVAITLLVLDLKLPPGVTDSELPKALAESMHGLWCYVLSFLVIGLLWMAHHHQFSYIERVDGVLMWLNLFFLMTVGLIPFVTSVMSDHGIPLPTMLYAGVLFITCLLLAAMWGYACSRPKLMEHALSKGEQREGTLKPLLTALVFAISIPVAYGWGSGAGQWTWLLAIPAARVASVLK
jgi:uncharacterized membrane protein